MSEQIPVSMTVNGRKVQRFVDPRLLLIDRKSVV